uniref:Ig-like domain-containing protein n=1 Tax=Poecilia latipinna TaxID=48699 RepID=A0A3B3TMY8_9TELE
MLRLITVVLCDAVVASQVMPVIIIITPTDLDPFVSSDPGSVLVQLYLQMQRFPVSVHSFYSNQDQLGHQDQNFRGRTSLFLDQVSRGNASLLLRDVQLQDEGRYNCYISTTEGYKETLEFAPVSDIRIHQDGNRITCSSEGIYPQPELTWSTEPPSNMALQNRTTVHQTEEKLYDISSSLTGPDGPDLTYSCRNHEIHAEIHSDTVFISDKSSWMVWLVIGIILIIVTFSLLLCFCWKRRKGRNQSATSSE